MNRINKRKDLVVLSALEAYEKAKEVINKLYSTEGGKKFVHSLIYAFTKSCYKVARGGYITDCLTDSELYSVEKIVPNDYEHISVVRKYAEEYKMAQTIEEKSQIAVELEGLLTQWEFQSEKTSRLALRSLHVNKVLGVSELTALTAFIEQQIGEGNEIIAGIIRANSGIPNKKSKPKTKKFDDRPRPIRGASIGSDSELSSKLKAALK